MQAAEPQPGPQAPAVALPTIVVLPEQSVRVVAPGRRRRVPAPTTDADVAFARFAPTAYSGSALPLEAQTAAPPHCCKYRTLPGIWVVSSTLEDAGFQPTTEDDRDFNMLWVAKSRLELPTALPNSHPKLGLVRVLAGLRPHQRVNHYPGTTALTVKDSLVQGLRVARDNALRQGLDPTAFDFLPVTYALPAELPALLRAQAQNPERTWILKPAGGSGGREIAITSSAKEMKAYSAERDTGTADTLPETSIASHYIDAPLLVDERKTDLRVYVLVTSFQPLRAYIYREGLCRFALRPYTDDPALLDDQSIHLTNYTLNANMRIIEPPRERPAQLVPEDPEGKSAVQLQHEIDAAQAKLRDQIEAMSPIAEIVKLQKRITELTHRRGIVELREGNPDVKVPQPKSPRKIYQPTIKWTLTDLDTHLRSERSDADVDMAWQKLSELVLLTLRSAQDVCAAEAAANVPYRGNCFELFGFDIMLDDALKPWLIEVNLSPSLECPTTLDHQIKAPLVADTFNVVGVPSVPIASTADRCAALREPQGTEAEAAAELGRSIGTRFWRVSPKVDGGDPFRFGISRCGEPSCNSG